MRISVVLILLSCTAMFGQSTSTFGVLSIAEKEFARFDKDTTANAVYLFEKGENFFQERGRYIRLITRYHAKVKILKKEGFDQATIEIPYYHNDDLTEKVGKIVALTHNGIVKDYVKKAQVYDVDLSERWSAKKFTFPKISVGSILEYTYEVESPFFFNLSGWKFQADIPKVYTEYNAKIPGNWVYNRSLIGSLELDFNDAKLEKNCFSVSWVPNEASCEVLKYAMRDVPAFKESEAFMLSSRNYRSNLEFELSQYTTFKGARRKFTKTWKDVDEEFRTEKNIGQQLRKKNFFEKNVPVELLTQGTLMERAKNIYSFVQNHYTWNKKYRLWRDNKVKKAFEEGKGSIAEINITLINLLNAAGIETKMMMSSTRNHGLPKKTHPVISDFNYILAKATIDGKDYLLDATDKFVPFGMLPYRCLNYYGRVMDFDSESYWQNIVPEVDNKRVIRAQISYDLENGIAKGGFNDISTGYESIRQRKKLSEMGEDTYVSEAEGNFEDDIFITDHVINEQNSNEKRLIQQFKFELEDIFKEQEIFVNPFLIRFFDENPFKAEERNYPVDFGYPRKYEFALSMAVPEGYKVKSLPEKMGLQLPGEAGLLKLDSSEEFGRVSVSFEFSVNATQINSKAYELIKTFFGKAVEIQNQSYIVLERV